MAKRIAGAFKSEEEALKTIDELEAEGYLAKDLQILTTNKDADNFRGNTSAYVESEEAEAEKADKPSLVDKLKGALPFMEAPDNPSAVQSKLEEMGVSEEEAKKFAPSGDTGSIFIIVEENPDGNAAGGTTKKKLVVREGVTAEDNTETSVESKLTEEPEVIVESEKISQADTLSNELNPAMDKNTQVPVEGTLRAGDKDRETPVAPNPPVGGIEDANGNSDYESVREEGTPKDHAHTPLDKTEADMEKRENAKENKGKNSK